MQVGVRWRLLRAGESRASADKSLAVALGGGLLGAALICCAPAAVARVTIDVIEAETMATTFNVSATTMTTGYFTVHRGLGQECGSAAQVRSGVGHDGAAAYRHGSLPLKGGMISRHTVAELEHNSVYTLCLTDSTEAEPVSRNFVTELLRDEDGGSPGEPWSVGMPRS